MSIKLFDSLVHDAIDLFQPLPFEKSGFQEDKEGRDISQSLERLANRHCVQTIMRKAIERQGGLEELFPDHSLYPFSWTSL